jgi:peptide deformylase
MIKSGMNREIIQNGNPILKAPNKSIDNLNNSKFREIVDDLIDSMRSNDLIGIAAPQIGENWKVFVTETRETKTRTGDQIDELRFYVNPKIINFSEDKTVIWEGCGSYEKATIFGPVKRAKEITIEASDLNGKRFNLTCDGILARVIQHEYDHLDGIEFVERMDDIDDLKDIKYYLNEIKVKPKFIEASIITKKEVKEL